MGIASPLSIQSELTIYVKLQKILNQINEIKVRNKG